MAICQVRAVESSMICSFPSGTGRATSWRRTIAARRRVLAADEPVGVGIAIAHDPLHRSGQAVLPHRMWSPTYDAGNPPAGFCPGGGPKGPFLPGLEGVMSDHRFLLRLTVLPGFAPL